MDGDDLLCYIPACFFTNIEHGKQKPLLPLSKVYNEADYPKYDNYDAIEVGWVYDIPVDYTGVMGVPISFMEKYNPKQFEIVGMSQKPCKVAGKDKYVRLFIKHRV